jgi:hypothetical protein
MSSELSTEKFLLALENGKIQSVEASISQEFADFITFCRNSECTSAWDLINDMSRSTMLLVQYVLRMQATSTIFSDVEQIAINNLADELYNKLLEKENEQPQEEEEEEEEQEVFEIEMDDHNQQNEKHQLKESIWNGKMCIEIE